MLLPCLLSLQAHPTSLSFYLPSSLSFPFFSSRKGYAHNQGYSEEPCRYFNLNVLSSVGILVVGVFPIVPLVMRVWCQRNAC